MTEMTDTAQEIAWVRDVDGTGSLHVCTEGDPGAIAVYDRAALTAYGNARHKEGQEEMRESAVAKLDELIITARLTASLGVGALKQGRDAIAALPVESSPES